MVNAFKIPTVEEELTCCDTESVREVSMAENLSVTSDNLVSINAMLEKLDRYIFASEEKGNFEFPPMICMRDTIYANNFLAGVAYEKLKKLVDRICV